jgi:5-(carboxyamino)imidazole ribonucleotide mutase
MAKPPFPAHTARTARRGGRPPFARSPSARPSGRAPHAPSIAVIMGSQSDWETMRHAAEILEELGVAHEARIVSAHRTPERLYEFARSAKKSGLKVIIAGAGGAAHLPGMVAALTTLPVLGVPVQSKALAGIDSLYSIVQMPGGVPVGTLAIGKAGAINAALLAASILALSDPQLDQRLALWRLERTEAVAERPSDPA